MNASLDAVLDTPLCRSLGIVHPIFALTHSVAVTAAVTNAGGFGVFAGTRNTPDEIDIALKEIASRVQGRPFGVNLLLPAGMPEQNDPEAARAKLPEGHVGFVRGLMEKYKVPPPTALGFRGRQLRSRAYFQQQVDAALASRATLFACAVGTPPEVVSAAKARDMRILSLVGSPRHVPRVLEAGAELIVAQGYDAGGHTGQIGTFSLIPQVVEAAGETPVLAAGGIGTGSQIVAALAMGAQGAWLGTLWLTTREYEMKPVLRRKYLDATSEDTVISRASSGKSARWLRTAWSDEWAAPEAPEPLPMPYQDILVGEIVSAVDEHGIEPLIHEAAGQSVAWCREETSVEGVMTRLLREAQSALGGMQPFLQTGRTGE